MLSYLQVDPNLGNHYLEAIYDHFVGHDPLERLYYGQWKTWLIEDVLMKDSRAASSCGLDLVAPFMTPELMQYMSQLSPAMKKLCLTDKNLLRIAMMKSLPKTILHKPKHKFWLPFAEWFRHEWRDCLRETLLASESFVCSSYGRRNIASLIDQHQLGTQDHNRVLWSLLFLEKWYHEFVRRRVDVV